MLERWEETMLERVAIKQVKTLLTVNPRFPEQGQSAQGQSVPKPRPKGVGDGKRVNIPVPPVRRLTDGGTQKGKSASERLWRSKRVGRSHRQIRGVNSETRRGGAQPHKLTVTMLPRKASKGVDQATVPQTDTGG